MYQVPTLYEYKSDLCPTHVVLCTYGYQHLFREVYKDSIVFGPALRFKHLNSDYKSRNKSKNNTICFLCEIDSKKSVKTLSRIISIIENIKLEEPINLIVKYHPTCFQKFILGKHKNINFIYNEGNLYDAFISSNIVVGSGTLSITESLLFNNYTILLSNNSGITQIPVPNSLRSFVNVVYSDNQLQESISRNLNYTFQSKFKYNDIFFPNSDIKDLIQILQ